MRNSETEKERIQTHVDALQRQMGMQWVAIEHAFRTESGNDDDTTIAETRAQWHYRQAHITWYLTRTMVLEDDELDGVIIHEFTHILLDPLWDQFTEAQKEKATKFNELSTENIARAIESVRRNK